MSLITLGLNESLAMRRLRRHASHGDMEERFDAVPCETCGRVWMWNPYIYPANEPHRCERCAPEEHWTTGVDRNVANQVFREAAKQERVGVM